jgi:hypothetical protein
VLELENFTRGTNRSWEMSQNINALCQVVTHLQNSCFECARNASHHQQMVVLCSSVSFWEQRMHLSINIHHRGYKSKTTLQRQGLSATYVRLQGQSGGCCVCKTSTLRHRKRITCLLWYIGHRDTATFLNSTHMKLTHAQWVQPVWGGGASLLPKATPRKDSSG